jgi:acetyl esterase
MSSPLSTAQELRATASGHLARAILGLPRPLLLRLAGPVPETARGLHPEAWMLARLATIGTRPTAEVPVEAGRRSFELMSAPLSIRRRPRPVAVSDRRLRGATGDLHGRLYWPASAPDPGPLLLFFHGGGWVRGSVATHHQSCLLLAELAGVRVMSIEYRLSPEHPFPAPLDDALAAYRVVAEDAERFGADPRQLAVGGDSAGGNIAAAMALELRDGDVVAPIFQLLIYPACDLLETHPSELTFGKGFFLTKANMDWYCDQYVPDRAQRRDPRASPLLAPDLAGAAPAYVATALADPLRDEGEAYARRLAEAGVGGV